MRKGGENKFKRVFFEIGKEKKEKGKSVFKPHIRLDLGF